MAFLAGIFSRGVRAGFMADGAWVPRGKAYVHEVRICDGEMLLDRSS